MKRLWSLLLVLLLVPCLVVAASAASSGSCGKNLTWTYDDDTDTLTISGTGEMQDYYRIDEDTGDEYASPPWWSQRDFVHKVIVEDGVTSIGSGAFCGSYFLNHVVLPDSLTSIGAHAFEDCSSLREITLPNNDVLIGKDAFGGRTPLSTLELPEKMRSFNASAFSGTALTEYIVCDDHPAFSSVDGILFNKDQTELIAYPAGRAFAAGRYTVPDSVVAIGECAFDGCSELQKLTIPASVERIGANAFRNCWGLHDVYITDLSAWIGIQFGDAYANPMNRTAKLYLNNSAITDLMIPEGTVTIGDYAFCGMVCPGSVTIPSSVTQIGIDAFAFYTSPTAIKITDTAAWAQIRFASAGSNPMTGNNKAKLYVNGSELTEVVLTDGVTAVGNYAFCNCRNLTKVVLPDSVKTIGEGAFINCEKLTDIRMPENLSEINNEVFCGCEALGTVALPTMLGRIGISAFEDCSSLRRADIPDTVTQIGSFAFAGCSALEEMELPAGLTELGNYAFSNCDRIQKLAIPGGVERIGSSAAENCDSLTSVTMGEGTVYIGTCAFAGCPVLKSVSFPSSIKTVYQDAFEGCSAMTDIHIQSVGSWMDLEIEDYIIGGDDGERYYFTEPRFASILNVNEKPKNLYLKGEKVTDLVIPKDVRTIQENCFRRFTFKSVSIPSTVTDVYKNAFAGCENLSKVYYAGSKTKREKIDIESGNGRLENASWVYNSNLELSAPVVKITGVASSGKPKVTWSAVEGAERYRVYRATSKTGTYTYLGYTTDLSYTNTTAKAGTNYYYKVTAFDSETQSASLYSNIVNRCCGLKKPVVTLKVDTASGKPKIVIEKISGAEKYYIVRSTSKTGTYSKLATVTGTSYIDKTAKAGTNYYYKVKALHAKDAADSVYSEIVNRVCDLAKPVVTITLKSGDPRIKWESITGAVKYMVYRATSKDGEYTHVKTTKTSTSYTDTDVKAGKTYYYKVMAIHENASANSAYSAVKYIKAQ